MSNVIFEVGTLSVNMGAPQWGFRGVMVDYLERVPGVTPDGGVFRERWGISVRTIADLRFAGIDTTLDQLAQVASAAGRSGERVKYIPDDTDLATYRWVDWGDTLVRTRVIENRQEIIVTLRERL